MVEEMPDAPEVSTAERGHPPVVQRRVIMLEEESPGVWRKSGTLSPGEANWVILEMASSLLRELGVR